MLEDYLERTSFESQEQMLAWFGGLVRPPPTHPVVLPEPEADVESDARPSWSRKSEVSPSVVGEVYVRSVRAASRRGSGCFAAARRLAAPGSGSYLCMH